LLSRKQNFYFSCLLSASLIRDIYCGLEVLFETCVVIKFMDNDDDDDDDDDATTQSLPSEN